MANSLKKLIDACREAGIDPVPVIVEELRRLGYTVEFLGEPEDDE